MAVELTDEMRRAVHREDCSMEGHQLDTRQMLAMDTATTKGGTLRVDIGGPDENTLPYVACAHCGVVWLVWPQEFENYAAALVAVRNLMKTPDVLRPKRRGVGRGAAAHDHEHDHGGDAARDDGAG